MSASSHIVVAEILLGSRVLRTLRLDTAETIIGSRADAGLRAVGDPSVAEEHAVLHIEDDRLCISAAGGAIEVNGTPVDFAVLQPRDVVKAGRLGFRARLEDAGVSSPAASPAHSPSPPNGAERSNGGIGSIAPAISPASPAPKTAPAPASKAAPAPAPKPAPAAASRVAVPQTSVASPRTAASSVTRTSAPAAAPAVTSPTAKASSPTTSAAARAPSAKASGAAAATSPATKAAPAPSAKPPTAPGVPATPSPPAASAPGRPPEPRRVNRLAPPPDGFEPDLYADDEEDDSELPLPEQVVHQPFATELLLDAPPAEVRSEDRTPRENAPVAEVLYSREGVVLDSRILGFGHGFKPRRRPSVARMLAGRCSVKLPDGASGNLLRPGGTSAPLRGPTKLKLEDGEELRFRDTEGFDYRIRVHRPPLMPRSAQHPFAYRLWAICAGVAVGAHVFLALTMAAGATFLNVSLPVTDPELAEQFAEVRELREPSAPKPKPKPKKPPPRRVQRPPKVDPTENRPKISKKMHQRIRKRIAKKGGEGGGATALLNQLRSPVAGDGETLKDVVSNIDAVGGRPTSGAHRVAGTLAALPDGKVSVASGGGGDLGTLSGKEIAGAAGKLRGRKGSGKVRGKVSTVRALAKVRGQLSRAQVLDVINKHVGAIQGCYERELLKSPGLSGKITFEWTVRPDGRVSGPRERASSLGSARVSQCILGVIRSMRFPRPKGGSVVISYPFMFRSVAS